MGMNQFNLTMLVAGTAFGSVLVLDEPLSLWGGLDPHTGEITDRRHPQSGEIVTNKVLLLPSGRGSSSASSILMEAIRSETAPAGMIMAEADGILALGAIVAQEVYGRTLPVGVLSADDYATVCNLIATSKEAHIKIDQTIIEVAFGSSA
ncbi:MAG: putative aconitase with swiveling domain [Cellvibrionaceae bacterium]|jgi:predicted aconitase with swiveling domain